MLDKELYEFFSAHAKQERQTMAGILRTHVLSLKKQAEHEDILVTMSAGGVAHEMAEQARKDGRA